MDAWALGSRLPLLTQAWLPMPTLLLTLLTLLLLLTPTTTLLLLTLLLLLLLLLLPLRRWPAIQARLCSAGGFKRDAEYPPVGNYHFNAYQSLIEKVVYSGFARERLN